MLGYVAYVLRANGSPLVKVNNCLVTTRLTSDVSMNTRIISRSRSAKEIHSQITRACVCVVMRYAWQRGSCARVTCVRAAAGSSLVHSPTQCTQSTERHAATSGHDSDAAAEAHTLRRQR